MSQQKLGGGLLVLAAVLWALTGQPVVPDAGQVQPGITVSEAELWDELARMVEAGRVADTDRLLATARHLHSQGDVSSLSRLDRYAQRFETITDANRAAVAAVVRGR